MTKARALYDFDSGGPSEISFRQDDILTILKQDVGEGWWEARKNNGEHGLVPESYLEIIHSQEPSIPPPLPPMKYKPQQPSFQQPTAPVNNEEWDDEWDDDDDSSTTTEQHEVESRRDDKKSSSSSHQGGINVFSRFSSFAKSGIEAYLFTDPKEHHKKLYEIIDTTEGPVWKPLTEPYKVTVASPKKESKFRGIKSFIAYQITPSFSNIQVSRRYKHFDWLMGRLVELLPVASVPPLPEKQISGRFEDDFVLQRLHQLQLWMDRMSIHPVVARSEVFVHFVSCTDNKRWKVGKRLAERDDGGAEFFKSVLLPPQPSLDNKQAEGRIERFSRFSRSLDESVKQLTTVAEASVKKHTGPLKKEYERLGWSFVALAKSFELDQRQASAQLTRAVEHTGNTYNQIGEMFAKQPSNDLCHLLEGLHEYKGLLTTIPQTLHIYKSAQTKIQEQTNKMSASELQKVQERSEVISYSVLADIEHFERHRVADFNNYMKHFLTQQIHFYQQIAQSLEDSLKLYEN